MDIVIKSFNRPYYLDRCLFSIKQNVLNFNGKVFIVDDGTPQKYLHKIKEKYPFVEILKSNYYDYKSQNLKPIIDNKIPISFWVEAVRKCDSYLLLLEDDFWITSEIDVSVLENEILENEVVFLKLFWLNNNKLISSNVIKKLGIINIVNPNLFTYNPTLYKKIFRTFGYKFNEIMKMLKLYTKERNLSYYQIYAVAGCVFKKDFFIELWNDSTEKVDEGLQIFNALKYFKKNQNSYVAHTKKEYITTGFSSSATLNDKNFEGIELNIFEFNQIINEAWLNDDFDSLNNFPKDFKEEEIERVLVNSNQGKKIVPEWKKWKDQFKKQYEAIGCKIVE